MYKHQQKMEINQKNVANKQCNKESKLLEDLIQSKQESQLLEDLMQDSYNQSCSKTKSYAQKLQINLQPDISKISQYSSISLLSNITLTSSTHFSNIKEEESLQKIIGDSFLQNNNQNNNNLNIQQITNAQQQINPIQNYSNLQKNQSEQSIQDKFISKLQKGCENDQSIANILTDILQGSKQMSTNDSTTTLVLGVTGSGKTSFSAFLSGQELMVKTSQSEDDYPYIDYRIQDPQRKIGTNDLDSETQIPNKFMRKNGNIIWDCPGLVDSKGVEYDIINSFYMSKIISNSKNINFIITINGPSFESKGYGDIKGKALKILIGTLFSMAQGTNLDLSQNVLIIFTKTKKEREYYQKKLGNYFNEILSKKGLDPELLKFYSQESIQQFIQRLKLAKVEIFPSPDKNQKEQNFQPNNKNQLLQSLDNIKYYNGNDINIPFSINSLEKLEQMWSHSHKIICDTFCNLFQTFSQQLINFRQELLFNRTKILLLNLQEINFKSMLSNEKKLNEIKKLFIQPFLKILEEVTQKEDYKQLNQQINEDLEYIGFFLIEVYDKLLCKANFCEKGNTFFGKFEKQDFSEGIEIFQNSYSKSKLQFRINQIEQEKKQLIEQQQALNNQLNLQQVNMSKLKQELDKQMYEIEQKFQKQLEQQQEENKKFEEESKKMKQEKQQLEKEREEFLEQVQKQKQKQKSSGWDFIVVVRFIASAAVSFILKRIVVL